LPPTIDSVGCDIVSRVFYKGGSSPDFVTLLLYRTFCEVLPMDLPNSGILSASPLFTLHLIVLLPFILFPEKNILFSEYLDLSLVDLDDRLVLDIHGASGVVKSR
jgi:hypothetical protein